MTRRKWLLAALAVLALVAAVMVSRSWKSDNAVAQNATERVVPVAVARAEKKPVPVRLQALGNVTTIASVAIKARLETTITDVHFEDGAQVKQGDLLFTLDGRQIEAQIQQAEANLARDKAQLEQAQRDVARFTELVAKGATTQVNLDNARTQSDIYRAAIKATEAALQNLKVQLSYCRIAAPISGRISAANVRVGNLVRPGDTSALATINQMAPVYVSFAIPQRMLPDIRKAIAAETATIDAIVPGDNRRASGTVTMVENTVDAATGMVTIRATMPNKEEILWPGTLVNTDMTLRVEEAVTVPSTAVQVSQTGNFVFVVKDNVAHVQPVKVERREEMISVIADGLQGGETVVTDGQMLLSNGSKVSMRGNAPGA